MLKIIRKRIELLKNPEKGFKELRNLTLERAVSEYLKLLILVGVLAALYVFVSNIAKTFYLDLFQGLEIKYWFMLNYLMGKTVSAIFFYFFAGTFIMFFVSVILNPFFRNIKYPYLLKIVFYSLTPLLLFGWIIFLVPSLFVWSIFLFVIGVRSSKGLKVSRDSIQNRE
ncbi:YIP1 family protein [Candidatus Woesearchaeota archaeon]|nr:YIP1 family protein [Candidatus Woesearchaeota archaeon]